MATPLHQLLPPKAIVLQQLPLQGRCLRGAEGQGGGTETERQTLSWSQKCATSVMSQALTPPHPRAQSSSS